MQMFSFEFAYLFKSYLFNIVIIITSLFRYMNQFIHYFVFYN